MKGLAIGAVGVALAIPAYNALGNYLQSSTQGSVNLPVITADVQLYVTIAALVVFFLLIYGVL